MQSKIRLVNICIRHKCSRAKADDMLLNYSCKKIIRTKPEYNSENIQTNLTSKHAPVIGNLIAKLEPSERKKTSTEYNTSYSEKTQNNTTARYSAAGALSNDNLKNTGYENPNVKIIKRIKHKSKVHSAVKAQKNADDISFSENPSIEKPKDIDIEESGTEHNNNERNVDNGTRVNEINMQMLPQELHEQLFKNIDDKTVPNGTIKSIKENFKKFQINLGDAPRLPNVKFQIPPLEGKDLEEHFYNIATAQTKPYLKIINGMLQEFPTMPNKWLLQEGWTRYTENGAEKVDYPLEEGLIFDVEVCMKEGALPTLATAVSSKAWYGWVSNSVIEGPSELSDMKSITTDMMIPIESTSTEHGKKLNNHQKKPKIIVGHNVSFDRSRIKEQYWLNSTGTRFIDTMSLHICVSGVNSYQKALLKSDKYDVEDEYWQSRTSLNSLAEVYKLYCNKTIDKKSRDIFIEGSLSDVKENFNDLMVYCAFDVKATHDVLRTLFPIFQERFPHPVTLAGMLELGTAYLPVNSNWTRYIEESESTFEDLNYEAKFTLAKRADEVCQLMHNEKYKQDLWMWDQDWSTQDIKMKSSISKDVAEKMKKEREQKSKEESDFAKYLTDGEDEEDPLEKEFGHLEETKYFLPAKPPHMPGYPAWYRKLCMKQNEEDWAPGPQNISTSMQVVPKLLNLTWENYPLHYIREHGWGILVPHTNDPEIQTNIPLKQLIAQCPLPKSESKTGDEVDYAMSTLRTDVQDNLAKTEFWRYRTKKNQKNTDAYSFYKGTGIWCNVDIDNCCYFFKLPHKDGMNRNVGNPLAKDFLNKFSENVLAGLDASAAQVLKLARMVSYWRNNRDRIKAQLVAWWDESSFRSGSRKKKDEIRYGAIIPQVVVSGTLTRRAVESTWMTASNAHPERVGSELRSMIQAPPGYSIVGADVDSQELWIASVIGDSHYAKIHGATPFGWMTLVGTKSNGTDMHSVTAKAVGISRDHAKVINYARIYGAGQKFATRLLKQFNPSMTESEASTKASKMFALTKGKKVYKLNPKFVNNDMDDHYYSSSEAYKMAKVHGKSIGEMFLKKEWIDGSESAMFNRLEEIAGSPEPVTPFLGSRLSRALEGCGVDDEKYLPTKVNWVVQSGAVDFLHLMLVCMRWLMRDNARFCLSFHDEVRYIVPTRYKYNAALAMHLTNLMTRCFCASRLGMKDLPMSVAFFAAVEVDTVLRKESSYDCKTPSNPHGLEAGYGVPPGESLDVWATLEKSGGSLGPWHVTKTKNLKT